MEDRYGLAVSTTSTAARDAYVQGCDRYLSMYPGALAAFDQAIAADPGFALPFVAKARVQQLRGDVVAARESMAAANEVASGRPPREASHLAFFGLLVAGQAAPGTGRAAGASRLLAARRYGAQHLGVRQWPDRVVGSRRAETGLLALMDDLAPSYGDDWWFTGHHAFALAENAQHQAARTKIDRSLARKPTNAYGAHTRAHLCYEAGDLASGQNSCAPGCQPIPEKEDFTAI